MMHLLSTFRCHAHPTPRNVFIENSCFRKIDCSRMDFNFRVCLLSRRNLAVIACLEGCTAHVHTLNLPTPYYSINSKPGRPLNLYDTSISGCVFSPGATLLGLLALRVAQQIYIL